MQHEHTLIIISAEAVLSKNVSYITPDHHLHHLFFIIELTLIHSKQIRSNMT